MTSLDPACGTVAIVGAGFSGAALAYRLLQSVGWRGRVLLIERTGQFGPGLAYSALTDNALLNVPAGNMSLDESRPNDFVDYLRDRGRQASAHDFVPRRLYGLYLRDRLDRAAQGAPARRRLERVHGAALSITPDRSCAGRFEIAIDDGRRVAADHVVVATGHARPAVFSAFAEIEGSPHYVHDPWSRLPSPRARGRVLVVGTGLTMADVVTELLDRPGAPERIYAVSRRGFVPNDRVHSAQGGPPEAPEASAVVPESRLRRVFAAVRRAAEDVQARGGDWREVMVALRMRTPPLWHDLPPAERRRFLRHLQPYWDVHRHLLPPPVGHVLRGARESGRLEFRAARVVAAKAARSGVTVTLQRRGSCTLETLTVDQVVNCTGPVASPAQDSSRLIQRLIGAGLLSPDATGCGVAVDAECRLLDPRGHAIPGLHYLGPWLRARDWEMTAVPDLRRAATALAGHLVSRAASQFAPRRVEGMR